LTQNSRKEQPEP